MKKEKKTFLWIVFSFFFFFFCFVFYELEMHSTKRKIFKKYSKSRNSIIRWFLVTKKKQIGHIWFIVSGILKKSQMSVTTYIFIKLKPVETITTYLYCKHIFNLFFINVPNVLFNIIFLFILAGGIFFLSFFLSFFLLFIHLFLNNVSNSIAIESQLRTTNILATAERGRYLFTSDHSYKNW